MLKRRPVKQRGKVAMSKYFQKFKAGDSVAISRELGETFGYSHRTQGRTGKVIEKRGSAYYIEVKDADKPKRYAIRPIHLIKIEDAK